MIPSWISLRVAAAAIGTGFVVASGAGAAEQGAEQQGQTVTDARADAAGTQRRIRLKATPTRVFINRKVRFVFRATSASSDSTPPPIPCNSRRDACTSRHRTVAVAGAQIRFAGRTAKTDRRGRATIRVALGHEGRFTARASKEGLRRGTTVVRARRPQPTFTG